jgi:GntR family transcriptional regulator
VQDRLRAEIAAGSLKEGDLIPSEQELAKRFKVSQGTIRKAISELTQKGLFYRRQGKGTFVVFEPTDLKRNRNFRFVRGLDSELVEVINNFLKIQVVEASTEVADSLGLRKGSKVIHLERISKVADQFLAHSISYLPRDLYRGLEKYTAEDFAKNTLWKLQEIYFGIRAEKRQEFISAVAADPAMARRLEVKPGSPLLRIEMKLTSFHGDVAEYRVIHCNVGPLRFYVGHRSA